MEVTAEVLSDLRMLVGERIPAGSADVDTLLLDVELSRVVEQASTMTEATAHGWAIKAAILSELIDIDESGSNRKLSQRHTHAMKMLDFWAGRTQADADSLLQAARRAVVGVSAKWGDHAGLRDPILVDAMRGVTSVRLDPLHRWRPAIKG